MSDVWDWGKGAVEDIWGAASGQNKFRAEAYDPAKVGEAQSPWLQDLKTASGAHVEAPYQSRLSQDAAELRTGQQPTYDAMGNLIGGFNPEASATRVEGVADAYGQDVARQAAGIESLASEVAGAPSYADEASRAAMDRAASEATARAASTRGANAALQMREAAGATAGAARQAASEAGALKAQEMNQRFQTRGGLLASAAGVTGQGAATQGSLYGAAGDQRRMGMQAGVDALGNVAGQQRDDVATRANITTQAGQLGLQGQQQRTEATQAGLAGATQGQQIAAASHDNAQNANAGITSSNAAGTQKATTGALTMGGSLLADASDVRVKEDIRPLSSRQQDLNDVYQPDLRGLPTSWGAPAATPAAPEQSAGGGSFANRLGRGMMAGFGAPQSEQPEEKKGGLFGKALMLGAKAMMSDERAKEDVSPIVAMAVNPEENREALGPVHPYQFRYKEDLAKAAGVDTEPRAGIMAQDLEKSEAGDAVVQDGPVKTLDQRRALGFTMAGLAGVDKRLALLEQAVGRG